MGSKHESAYVRLFFGVRSLKNFPQHIDRGFGLYGDAGEHIIVVNIADEVSGVRLALGGGFRVRSVSGEGGLIVEAVKIAADVFKGLDPFLGLFGHPGQYDFNSRPGHPRIEVARTSATIMWQSNVPRPWFSVGLSTKPRILATTGAPNVMLGTKWPSLLVDAARLATRECAAGDAASMMLT